MAELVEIKIDDIEESSDSSGSDYFASRSHSSQDDLILKEGLSKERKREESFCKSPINWFSYICQKRFTRTQLKFWIFLMTVGLIIFMLLWLAESQFSTGVLRLRYRGEPCGKGLILKSTCAFGFICDEHSLKCEIDPKLRYISPYDDYFNYGNGTPHDLSCISCLPCEPCPPVNPPAIIQKIVSFFDFNELPNHWLDAGPHGFYNTERQISYGACKELCAKDPKCHAVCYNGLAQMCWQTHQFNLPAIPNNTYTVAIKTGWGF